MALNLFEPNSRANAKNKKRGLLILNLGTPDAPEPIAVGRYLREFLMDKWVIDIPAPIRWFLVNVLIVPKRKYESAKNYASIWTKRGSPLLYHLLDLKEEVRHRLPESDWQVEVAMRYGSPSIEEALKKLSGTDISEIFVFPLYPQYAESTTRSSEEKCRELAQKLNLSSSLFFIPPYYEHPGFIASFAAKMKPVLDAEKPDHVLMTFHGLPERHVKRTDRSGGQHCLKSSNCCAQISSANRDCYRAQCFATARSLAQTCGLSQSQYTVAFQSRLGRDPWIRPYTEDKLHELGKSGVKTLAVVCPSFAADCLETLEEIAERGAETFKESGGTNYHMIPCLNSDAKWADEIVGMIKAASENQRPLG